MANEIRTQYPTGYTLYALLWNEDDEIYYPVGEEFETYGTSSRDASDYAISLTEQSAGYYTGDYPSIDRGIYYTVLKLQSGSSPADSDRGWGPAEKYWTGTAVVTVPETNAVNICNRALAKLGGGEDVIIITALGDGTPTSDLCEILYTPVRKRVLKRMEPQECTYYADLGDESSYSGEMAEWDYVFDLPSDFLHLIKQTDERYHKMDYPYEIKQGSYLFTNIYSNDDSDSAYIEYVKNETDGSVFGDEVIEAIVTLLAAELAPQTIGGEWAWKRRQELLDEFEQYTLPTAMGINRSQQYHEEEPRDVKFECLGGRWEVDD